MSRFTVSGRPLFDIQVEAADEAQARERWHDALHALSRPDVPAVEGLEMAFFSDDAGGGEEVSLFVDEIGAENLFYGYDWTIDDQEAAQTLGWELSEFSDGQICIGAHEEQDIFTGENAHLDAHRFVEIMAENTPDTNEHGNRARRALEIAKASYQARLADDEAEANDPAAQAFRPAD